MNWLLPCWAMEPLLSIYTLRPTAFRAAAVFFVLKNGAAGYGSPICMLHFFFFFGVPVGSRLGGPVRDI